MGEVAMVTRAEFVQAIRNFKKLYKGKLKDLLDKESHPETAAAFWSDPVIHAYLGRPSVVFVDKHPQLKESESKEDHETSDHYELKVYKYLPNAIVYRNEDINSPKFYTNGTLPNYELFTGLFHSFTQGMSDIEVMEPGDTFLIGDQVTTMFLNPEQKSFPRFILNPNWTEQHATAVLTVLDPITGRALVSLFINSFQLDEYYYKLGKEFSCSKVKLLNLKSCSTEQASNLTGCKNYLNKTFAVDIDDASLQKKPPTLLVNKVERTVFIINYRRADYNSSEYCDIENSSDIETFFTYKYTKKEGAELSLAHYPKIPFIDVSHHLQVSKDDENCVLYSMNFIKAMVEMLSQPKLADSIYDLARSSRSNQDSINTLIHIFQEDLKAYLPCYYRKTGEPKSKTEIEEFHLNQRWDVGGKSLSILHPLKQETKANLGFFSNPKTVLPEVIGDATIVSKKVIK